MADIRSYMKDKEKRERKQEDYKDKIARHKLAFLTRVLLAAAVLIAVVLFFLSEIVLRFQRVRFLIIHIRARERCHYVTAFGAVKRPSPLCVRDLRN